MKTILLIAFIAFAINTKAQITLEHDYDSASTVCHTSPCRGDQLMIIHFEATGYRYVNINREGKYISIYDMNHSLVKKIDCSGLPTPGGGGLMSNVIYLSDNLFNMDSKIEFLYGFVDGSGSSDTYYTGIYNEDGVLLFSDTAGVPVINVNIPQQQYPIYNTSQGTKMILSYANGHAKVFSLPGTLSTDIAKANENLLYSSSLSIANAYPNPVINNTRVDYKLPDGINDGVIVFYDIQGTEIKRFKVDRSFDHLLISTSDIRAGTYYYQLQTKEKNSVGKKMVVVK